MTARRIRELVKIMGYNGKPTQADIEGHVGSVPPPPPVSVSAQPVIELATLHFLKGRHVMKIKCATIGSNAAKIVNMMQPGVVVSDSDFYRHDNNKWRGMIISVLTNYEVAAGMLHIVNHLEIAIEKHSAIESGKYKKGVLPLVGGTPKPKPEKLTPIMIPIAKQPSANESATHSSVANLKPRRKFDLED